MTGTERDGLRRTIDARRRELAGLPPRERPTRRATRPSIAGMRAAFEELSVATVAEAATLRKVHRSSAKAATRALESEGAIRPTGRKRGSSREYEWVGSHIQIA